MHLLSQEGWNWYQAVRNRLNCRRLGSDLHYRLRVANRPSARTMLVSKRPILSFHEAFQRHAWNAEVTADVRDFRAVGRFPFERHDRPLNGMGAGHDERVRIPTSFQQLTLLNDLLEMWHRKNLPNE